MSIFEWLSVASNVASVIGLIITLKQFKMKAIVTNPYAKVLGFSLIFTLLVFLVPWNKIHYGDNESVKSSVVIHERVRIIHDTIRDARISKPIKSKEHFTEKVQSTQINHGVAKQDSSKNKADVNVEFKAPVTNSPMQIGGSGNLQVNGRLDHHPVEADVNTILRMLPAKDRKLTIAYETPDIDSKNYSIELKEIIKKYGYKQIELFGHLNVGTPPQQSKIVVDTVNYVISVEWN